MNNCLHICLQIKLLLVVAMLSGYNMKGEVQVSGKLDTLPHVFMIGQHEIEYEDLVAKCSNPLLTVCKDSMDLAYKRWMGLLSEMEQYAENSDFDIKGIKIWLNVFWNPDGTIKHLVFFPKPNSRNMDFNNLTLFFEKFTNTYEMESLDSKCYSHYGSASFPTFADYYLKDK